VADQNDGPALEFEELTQLPTTERSSERRGGRKRVPLLTLGSIAAALLAVVHADVARAAGARATAGRQTFRDRIRFHAREPSWTPEETRPDIDRDSLVKSIEAARAYMLNNQKPEGDFVYEYDIIRRRAKDDNNQVRQAGALWGLASLCRDRPTDMTHNAVVRGLDFFFRNSKPVDSSYTAPIFPDADEVKTGMVALVCLAITDFCRGRDLYRPVVGRGFYDSWLTQYMNYLQHMEMENGSWGRKYTVSRDEREGIHSPYYDGECLLAYCRAARYMNRKELIPKIERIALKLAEHYTTEAWDQDLASEETKGFSQWGCMAFAEYVEAGWKDADVIGDAAMALAWWLVHEYRILLRRGNTAYAAEGLLAACRVAKVRNDLASLETLQSVVIEILQRLLPCQIGGPFEEYNPFLQGRGVPALAFGGIMSQIDSGVIRIDTVQHQLHAMLMALNLLYPQQ